MLMGNRGCLHDANRRITGRPAPVERWITCLTKFKRRKRPLMMPGRYTELFFLDEVTAFAAGHRPCFECRREAAIVFAGAFSAGLGRDPVSMAEIDRILAPERRRLRDGPAWPVGREEFIRLPDGIFLNSGDDYFARKNADLLPWSFSGYGAPVNWDDIGVATMRLVTSPSIVAAFRHGYAPGFHPSAEPIRA